jgi:hypothetical protein
VRRNNENEEELERKRERKDKEEWDNQINNNKGITKIKNEWNGMEDREANKETIDIC